MKKRYSDKVVIRSMPLYKVWAEIDQRLRFELNQLLKDSFPNPLRIHQLTKLMCRETECQDFTSIKNKIIEYYKYPFERRTGGQFLNIFGIRPYPWLHGQFLLNFANAHISETKISKLASTVRHLIKFNSSPPPQIIDTNFIHLVLFKMLHPRIEEKTSGLNLRDFFNVWQKTSQAKWGEKYNFYFDSLKKVIITESGAPDTRPPVSMGSLVDDQGNDLELTQTELDWMKNIIDSIEQRLQPPRYPISKGPNNPHTRHLEKVVRAICLIKEGPSIILLENTAHKLCSDYLSLYGQQPTPEHPPDLNEYSLSRNQSE